MNQSFFHIKRAILILSASIWGIAAPGVMAIELSDGTVWFEKSPRLIKISSTYSQIYLRGSTYYFTLELPQDVGEQLGKVVINQRQGFEDIRFKLEDTRAFVGTNGERGESLTIEETTQDEQTGAIAVKFGQAVDPGKTVTVGLRPIRNPITSGAYVFGVTAFPAGEKSHGIYLGSRSLRFTEGSEIDSHRR
ncbi:MAG: DUF2808 domain-containing protein [Symploca sp. SIO2E9]|nr:DUF2808 domain-containing protein [Symploca sp. SIO2E9]